MARPNWEYIRVDVLLPGHPKLAGLPRSARWTLVELWCFAGRYHTDGFISDGVWGETGPAADRRRLVERGLAERVDGGYQMHDYTEHNRSRDEIEQLSARRAEAGRKGGSARRSNWEASASASGKQTASAVPKQTEAEAEAEAEADKKSPPARERAAPPGPRATRLPGDFAVSRALAAWAAENVPGLDYATETMRFRDYWQSAAGAKARKTDWEATWRNWMRRAADDLAARQPRGPSRPSHQPSHDEFEQLRQNWARPLDAIEAANDPR